MSVTKPDLNDIELGNLAVEMGLDNSILTRCLNCNLWGTNLPGKQECGNCRSTDTVLYIPSDSVRKMIAHIKEKEGTTNVQSSA